jgi:hypothetical protein
VQRTAFRQLAGQLVADHPGTHDWICVEPQILDSS